jgi:HD-GYP domain-containing protein (c-di-GMP phosphodiesterase class II)
VKLRKQGGLRVHGFRKTGLDFGPLDLRFCPASRADRLRKQGRIVEMAHTIECTHPDLLNELNRKATVSEKITFIHRVVRQHSAFIHRIGVAVYDAKADNLKTLAHSTDGENPLPHYQSRLREAKSLYRIYLDGKPRVINDLAVFDGSSREHAKRINAHGYRSSYTVPMYHNEQLTGFVFFNSRLPGSFQEDSLPYLDMIARLVSLVISVELNQVLTLQGALKTATCFSSHKDPETGAHLERMARFSRLIANDIAADHGLNDEFVEAIFWFAPMHDVGKIAIPDHIIRKPSSLTADEFEVMKTHATRGREIVETMMDHFNLDHSNFVSMICNIAEYHHENINGSGYPRGLKGDDIPVEARIIAVADVFDALTSRRAYKDAWSNEAAYDELRRLSTWKLDAKFVDVLINNPKKILEIQNLFQDEQDRNTAGKSFPERNRGNSADTFRIAKTYC